MERRPELEAAMHRTRILAGAKALVTPAADRLGKFDHVLLAIAAVHADCVQLQDFAGEVLVEGSRLSVARQPLFSDVGLRADRDDIVLRLLLGSGVMRGGLGSVPAGPL